MPSNPTPRTLAFHTSAVLGTPPADWDASGSLAWAIEPDTSSVAQESLPNENYRQGMLRGHPMVRGLKRGEAQFSQYLTGRGANAAEGAQATTTQVAENMRCAMGGRTLGYGAGVASATGAVLDVDAGQGANFVAGQMIFVYDTSASTGYVYRILSIATDALTLDRSLEFTATTADRVYASINCYLHEDSLTDFADADHITRSIFVKGVDAGDRCELISCKLAAELSGFASGEMPRVAFSVMAADFRIEDAANPDLDGTVEGMPPLVVGADRARIYIAPYGDPLAALDCAFSVEPKIGITWTRVPSLGGVEGSCGFVAEGFDDIGVKVSIPWDETYNTGYRNGSLYHLLVQVGDGPTGSGCVYLYFPRLEIKIEPARADVTSITASTIEFRALYNSESTALTGNDLELWRSPVIVGMVA